MYKVSVTIGCFYHRRAGPMTVMIHNISQTISTVMEVFLMEGKQEFSGIGDDDKTNIRPSPCHAGLTIPRCEREGHSIILLAREAKLFI